MTCISSVKINLNNKNKFRIREHFQLYFTVEIYPFIPSRPSKQLHLKHMSLSLQPNKKNYINITLSSEEGDIIGEADIGISNFFSNIQIQAVLAL